MFTNSSTFFKVWGMPIVLGIVTIIGLLLAIMGTSAWHIFSWITLSLPLGVMIKKGSKGFK